MTIKITWRTNQKEDSKVLACSVGPVRCGDLRQSTTNCFLPAPNIQPRIDVNSMVLSTAGAAGGKCLYSLRIKKAMFCKAGLSTGLPREAMDHDSREC